MSNINMDNKKGKLTIFISYTPGAGKSYIMAKRAAEEKSHGKNVVVGFFNSSHRDVEHLLNNNHRDAESFLNSSHRDAENFLSQKSRYSLAELISQAPDIVVMDEMGMHGVNADEDTFVYNDIEELLNGGIDVYTTANLKRFESANPLFKQVTGIGVRKTVPDKFLEMADSIVFVDREIDSMIQDFEEGRLFNKKYRDSKIMRKNFQQETLEAYRDISLEYLIKYENKVEILTNDFKRM